MLSIKEPCFQLKFMYLLWVQANCGVPGRDIEFFPPHCTRTGFYLQDVQAHGLS